MRTPGTSLQLTLRYCMASSALETQSLPIAVAGNIGKYIDICRHTVTEQKRAARVISLVLEHFQEGCQRGSAVLAVAFLPNTDHIASPMHFPFKKPVLINIFLQLLVLFANQLDGYNHPISLSTSTKAP